MAKLSSSLKKKRSKYSSPGRTKKKSKRTKSKKPRRRDDLDSHSGYESSSTSVSSSSSEDSYKGRKSRSYNRKDVKVSKKKSRARSSRSEGSHRLRKRKSSKRNDEYEGKKKICERSRKKKTRRDPSISSRSSGSRSYSTCQSESDSGEDSDYERRTNTSERRDGWRKLEKVKSRTRRKRHSTSSSSSYSRQNEDTGYWSEKEMNSEITSKRLRSVIIFAKEDNEGRDSDKDEHKEEMIYDHDEYPSSRSNDSNDGGIKGDFAQQSSFESERKKRIDDDQEYYAVASKSKAVALPETDKDREGQNVASKLESDRVRTDKYATNDSNNEFFGVVGSTDGDLESILRQRALENLKRFRGGSQATIKRHVNPKDDSGSSSKLSLATEAQPDQIRSSKSDGARASLEGSTHSLLKDHNVTEMKNADSESVSLESKFHPADADAGRANVRATTVHQSIKRPRLVASALKQALSDATTTPTEAALLRESNKTEAVLGNSVHRVSAQTSHIVNSPSGNTNFDKVSNVPSRQELFDAAVNPVEVTTLRESNQAIMATGSTVGESDGQVVHVTPGSSNSENAKVENVTSFGSIEPSRVGSAAGDAGSNKVEGEGKEDSQLQQKTMSVMRGGEMVQVSYKVYIPKKAPALARRRLKR